jgi:hypothetical protein
MRRTIALIIVHLFTVNWLVAETVTFSHVKIHRHRSPQGHMLEDREGILTFDDVGKKVTFQNVRADRFEEEIKFEAPYESVIKVVFDSTTHQRGEGTLGMLNFFTVVGVATAAAIGEKNVHDNWMYLEYKNGDRTELVLLMLSNDNFAAAELKAADLFDGRVVVSSFPERSEEIPSKQLRSADFKSKYAVKLDKTYHPLPADKPDRATIIVVCPMVGLDFGRSSQVKLHANDHVIAVNEMGTYSFAYLDPGKYRLISQSHDNDNGLEIELGAGKSYYFLQNSLHYGQTVLSRNSGEVVTYLAADTYFSEWKPK